MLNIINYILMLTMCTHFLKRNVNAILECIEVYGCNFSAMPIGFLILKKKMYLITRFNF